MTAPDLSSLSNAGTRRRAPRVLGPFEGRRCGILSTDIRIYDLSRGGCLIQSYHDVQPGRSLTIDIELPYEGWVTLKAETLYSRPDYGFAVKFVEVSEETGAVLDRVVARLAAEAAQGGS